MMKFVIPAAVLAVLGACATPVPSSFNGSESQVGNAVPLVIPAVPQPILVDPPTPVSTTSLDGPASSPVPRPSSTGMPPPPVEIGVVGPVPADLPAFEPLIMDEDVSG
ncbi:hypothetical protein [Loktanella salsilacus]|uniref:hypothetical protein n=1 Tax=Loktanella salsilacus TaxID=195913 RepID=UPI00356AA6E2